MTEIVPYLGEHGHGYGRQTSFAVDSRFQSCLVEEIGV